MQTANDLQRPVADEPAGTGTADAHPVRVVNFARMILFAAGVYLAVSFFDAIAKALLLFFGAFLIAIVLNAPVRALEARGVPRGASASGVALIVLGLLVTAGFVAGPTIADEAAELGRDAPKRLRAAEEWMQARTARYPALRSLTQQSGPLTTEWLTERASQMLPRVGRFTLGVFGVLATCFLLLVIALYTLGAPRPLVRGFLSAVPPAYRSEAAHALTRILGQLEAWALATLLLMLIVGVVSGLGMWALGVPNPLLFGILAGLGEAIPTIGPILSAVPPMLVSLGTEYPTRALWVAALFLVVQQLENNLLVPLIMGRALKLHPVSILFFVLALGAFVGILGAILAVPTAIIVKVLFEEFYEKKRAPKGAALDEAADKILRAGARPGRVTAPTPAPSQLAEK